MNDDRETTSRLTRRAFVLTGAAALTAMMPGRASLLARAPRPRADTGAARLAAGRACDVPALRRQTRSAIGVGDGREDPATFAPARLDARQWARVARAAGFRALILTAKHHDGFLPVAEQDDDPQRCEESLARRSRRCRARIRRGLPRGRIAAGPVPLPVGSQQSNVYG
jgi:hypothetical protein